MTPDNIVETFKFAAEAVQAKVTFARSSEEIARYVIETTQFQNGRTLVMPHTGGLVADAIRNAGKAAGIDIADPPFQLSADPIHAAVTTAEYGIAETGTVVLCSDNEDLRIATMLAEIHFVLLKKETICPTSMDLAPILDKQFKKGPGYLAFISGPSRTADIERVLTIGVHGPRELHILILT